MKSLNKKRLTVRLPYWLGYLGGLSFDLLAKPTGKRFSVSAVRVKKFCLPHRKERPYWGATTQFDATAAHSSGFKAPFTLLEGLNRTLHYEFIDTEKDEVVFESE